MDGWVGGGERCPRVSSHLFVLDLRIHVHANASALVGIAGKPVKTCVRACVRACVCTHTNCAPVLLADSLTDTRHLQIPTRMSPSSVQDRDVAMAMVGEADGDVAMRSEANGNVAMVGEADRHVSKVRHMTCNM